MTSTAARNAVWNLRSGGDQVAFRHAGGGEDLPRAAAVAGERLAVLQPLVVVGVGEHQVAILEHVDHVVGHGLAQRRAVAHDMIDVLKEGNLVFSYADNDKWLSRAQSFSCDGRSAGQILAAARRPDNSNLVAAAP